MHSFHMKHLSFYPAYSLSQNGLQHILKEKHTEKFFKRIKYHNPKALILQIHVKLKPYGDHT